MQQVTIPVEDSVLASLGMGAEEVALSMRREFALKAFKDGKLTLVQSARLCGMDVYGFISAVSQAGVHVIDYGIEEIAQELALLNSDR